MTTFTKCFHRAASILPDRRSSLSTPTETRYNLEPRTRRAAVSTYIEVMILMALVLAGSALVYVAAPTSRLVNWGCLRLISWRAIKQGADAAVETVTIANTGTVTITSFTMATVGVTSSSTLLPVAAQSSNRLAADVRLRSGTCSFTVPVCEPSACSPDSPIIATVTIDAISSRSARDTPSW